MSEMMERIARAIMESQLSMLGKVEPHHREVDWRANKGYHLEAARAVVEALREPPLELLQSMAGRAVMADCRTVEGARDIWSNVIHTLLKEPT